MISIIKAGEKDFQFLSEIAKRTFIESHEHSARPEDISNYVTENYRVHFKMSQRLPTFNKFISV